VIIRRFAACGLASVRVPAAFDFAGVPRRSRWALCWRTLAASVGVTIASTLIGCCPQPPPPHVAYNGPTRPMRDVVAAINANNAKLPSLWSRLTYQADLVDERGHKTTVTLDDGALLYRRPRSMLLRCTVVGNEAFTLGSNDDQFWVKVVPGSDTTWWGHYANLGKPCCKPLPIRPDLVLQVLGVGLFDTNFLQPPVPVMQFDYGSGQYVFIWNVPSPDQWRAQKEVRFNRETLLPESVRLFDENGRVILDARLSQHTPVELPQTPAERWPKIASHYELFFPDNGSRLSFTLDQPKLQYRGVPRDGSFRMPQPDTPNVVQIDRDCEEYIESGAISRLPVLK
jgi:hypothetical protein